MTRVTVIGDGGWGTALALLLCNNGCQVCVWGPFANYIEQVKVSGCNHKFLPSIALPPELRWTANQDEAVRDAEAILLATPSKFMRNVLTGFKGRIQPDTLLLSVTKGFDPTSHERPSVLAEQVLNQGPVAVLSGPSFAEEVARGMPTAVTLACADMNKAQRLQALLAAPAFRVYTSDDVVGVELGGALKNVIALAAGVSDGIGFGFNTRAALITRGLAEITRLGCALGAHPSTFAGLSGTGDLILTCTGALSRNRRVGELLGQGRGIQDVLDSMDQVAEGITTCIAARALAWKAGVEAPIINEVYQVIHQRKNPRDAVRTLLERKPRPEREI